MSKASSRSPSLWPPIFASSLSYNVFAAPSVTLSSQSSLTFSHIAFKRSYSKELLASIAILAPLITGAFVALSLPSIITCALLSISACSRPTLANRAVPVDVPVETLPLVVVLPLLPPKLLTTAVADIKLSSIVLLAEILIVLTGLPSTSTPLAAAVSCAPFCTVTFALFASSTIFTAAPAVI